MGRTSLYIVYIHYTCNFVFNMFIVHCDIIIIKLVNLNTANSEINTGISPLKATSSDCTLSSSDDRIEIIFCAGISLNPSFS